MRFGGKESYDNLKTVGKKYRSIEGYEHFAEYCLNKEKGLKKPAMLSMKMFIEEVKRESVKKQREISIELANLIYSNYGIPQLGEFHLKSFLIETFKKWSEKTEKDSTPYRWCGFFTDEISYYKKAVEIDSSDEVSAFWLINKYLDSVNYQTHHLKDGGIIGRAQDSFETLDEVKKLINLLKSSRLRERYDKEHSYYTKLIKLWLEYKKDNHSETFSKWCKEKGFEI